MSLLAEIETLLRDRLAPSELVLRDTAPSMPAMPVPAKAATTMRSSSASASGISRGWRDTGSYMMPSPS